MKAHTMAGHVLKRGHAGVVFIALTAALAAAFAVDTVTGEEAPPIKTIEELRNARKQARQGKIKVNDLLLRVRFAAAH